MLVAHALPDAARGGASTAAGRAPVRLLTVTTLFPNSCEPRHGIFVATRLRKLCDTGRVEASVIAPVPWFFGAYGAKRAIPASDAVLGFDVAHPRYLNIPRVGMRLQPRLLAATVLRHLRRRGVEARTFHAVDAHYFYPDGVAAAHVAQALGLPLVISARGSDINVIGEIGFARRAMIGAAGRARALIAVSAALAQRMASLGMPAERLHVLRNGVDTGVFRPADRHEARARLGLAEGRWVLGVGNLVALKRFRLLIEAVAALPGVRLLLVGEGPLHGQLCNLGDDIAPGRVEIRASLPQSELRFAYAACDVLGLPSMHEGWPNVVLESMACGTPVAAADVGGVPEMLGPDAPGLLVGAHDAHGWAGALGRLLDAGFSPERVRAHALPFAWDPVVDRQCALYEQIVAGDAPALRAHATTDARSVTLPCG